MPLGERKVELILQELIRRANRSDRRLRILEQRVQALDTRLSGVEDSSFKQAKELRRKLVELEASIRSLAERIVTMESEIDKLANLMKQAAKQSDLKELESMLSLFSPIHSQFVTKQELKRALEELKSKLSA